MRAFFMFNLAVINIKTCQKIDQVIRNSLFRGCTIFGSL